MKLMLKLTFQDVNCQINSHEFLPNVCFFKWFQVIDSSISLQLLPNQIWTLTTLQTGYKGTYASVPPTKPFPVPYNDSFDGKFGGYQTVNF